MKNLLRTGMLGLSLLSVLPLTAHAHRQWLLPSATVLSGNEPWLTVDAAVSNDLFYFEHQPMRLDGIKAYAPDGSEVKIENASTGRYRSTFDVKLTQKGTYKVSRASDSINASYLVNGELKRFRGTSDAFNKEVPRDAQDLQVARTHSRLELFVTVGSPSDKVLQPTGAGLELVPITHPNDLFAGESAQFRFILDGKPQAGVEVTLVPGGIRYRDQLGEIKTTTDMDGKFSVTWPAAGMYWLNASSNTAAAREGGTGPMTAQLGMGQNIGMGAAPNNTPVTSGNRATYIATLEVLPQ